MFRISELKQFSKFLETFQEISTPLAAVSKFWKVLVSEWKAPQVFAATLFPCCLCFKHKHPESRPSRSIFIFVFIKNLLVRSPPFRSKVEHNGLSLGNKPRSAHWCQVQRLNLLIKSEKVIWCTVEPPLTATSTTDSSLRAKHLSTTATATKACPQLPKKTLDEGQFSQRLMKKSRMDMEFDV